MQPVVEIIDSQEPQRGPQKLQNLDLSELKQAIYKQAIYSLSYDINNKDILSDVIAGLELEQHNGRR